MLRRVVCDLLGVSMLCLLMAIHMEFAKHVRLKKNNLKHMFVIKEHLNKY